MTIKIGNSNIPINQNRDRVVNSSDGKLIPTTFKNVAKGMESQFTKFMIEQMEKSIDRSTPDNSANQYYRSVMNSERAKAMAEKNEGLGLQKVILDQIYPKRLRNEIAFRHYEKQNAPTQRPNIIRLHPKPQQETTITMKRDLTSSEEISHE